MKNELSLSGVTSQVIEPRLSCAVSSLLFWNFPRFKVSFAFYFVLKRKNRVKCTLSEAHYTLYCEKFHPNDLVKAFTGDHVAKPCSCFESLLTSFPVLC